MSKKYTNEEFSGQIDSAGKTRKLDLIDRKILFLLSKNARYSNSSIAKTLKISREVVTYRINKLTEDRFLHGFFTLVNTKKLGNEVHIMYIKLFNSHNHSEIIEFLHKQKEITRLKEAAGNFDIQAIFSTKTIEELDLLINKFFDKYSSDIKDYVILRIVEEDFLGLDLLVPLTDRKNLKVNASKGSAFQKYFKERKAHINKVEIDDKDKKILDLLKLNARIPIKEISEKISLSPISIENRIKRMIIEGVIVSMYPLFAISQLGYQWYKVFFQVRNLNKAEFLEYLKQHDNVLWYMKLVGKWNYQFSIFAMNNIEFHNILNDIRNRFSDNIISYDSLIVLNQKKFVHRLE